MKSLARSPGIGQNICFSFCLFPNWAALLFCILAFCSWLLFLVSYPEWKTCIYTHGGLLQEMTFVSSLASPSIAQHSALTFFALFHSISRSIPNTIRLTAHKHSKANGHHWFIPGPGGIFVFVGMPFYLARVAVVLCSDPIYSSWDGGGVGQRNAMDLATFSDTLLGRVRICLLFSYIMHQV